jgi:hypothetical protein
LLPAKDHRWGCRTGSHEESAYRFFEVFSVR